MEEEEEADVLVPLEVVELVEIAYEREVREARLELSPRPPRLPRNCGASKAAYRSAAVTPVSRMVSSTQP